MKKKKDSATKNQKYLAIFLAATMFLSVFVVLVNTNSKTDEEKNTPVPGEGTEEAQIIAFYQVPGKQVQHEFNSLADGLEMSPGGPVNALYVDLQKTEGTPFEMALGDMEMINNFYGAEVTKRYSANYADGKGFELHQIPEQQIIMPWGAVDYSGYQLLARTNNTYDIWNVVGNPVILGSRQNVESVIDVIEGNATSAHEYDQLLSQASPEDSIYQEVFTNTGFEEVPFAQYYKDLRKLDDGSYSQTTIFQNPEPELTEKIATMQANCSERNVSYEVTSEGNITKLIITADFMSLNNETSLLLA
jgi:hypothetical protein